MEAAKQARTRKARTVTRRVHELENALTNLAADQEIQEKINNINVQGSLVYYTSKPLVLLR